MRVLKSVRYCCQAVLSAMKPLLHPEPHQYTYSVPGVYVPRARMWPVASPAG